MGRIVDIFDTLPFRVIKGAFTGLEDGMRGKIDTNEKFSDGAREEDNEKKSAAGQFLSDYSGIQGGAAVGQKIGQWGGGLASALIILKVMLGVLASGAAAGVLSGIFPLVVAGAAVIGAGIVGGSLLGVAGKYVGGFIGAGIGGVFGSVVGTYNAVFRKGKYAEKEKPPPPIAVPDAPQPGQSAGQGASIQPIVTQEKAEPTVIPKNSDRVQHILDNSLPPADKEDVVLAANTRVRSGFLSRMGQMFSTAAASVLGFFGVKSAVDTREWKATPPVSHAAPAGPRYAPAPSLSANPSLTRGDTYWRDKIRPVSSAKATDIPASPRSFTERVNGESAPELQRQVR